MAEAKPRAEGLAARRAALQILDAVLRRGRTLEAAAQSERSLAPNDHGLAIAIAGEVLRRMPDLDALIDSSTRNRMPDDSKARLVLRIALAQKLGLGTPDHAVVATALPLVDGGPRRLVHGVLGNLLRRGIEADPAPHLPAEVEQRWAEDWGAEVVDAARRQIASRPPLDLSFKSAERAQAFAAENGGKSLAPRHVRLHDAGAVTELPDFESGEWWVQDLAASLPARLIPSEAKAVLDLCSAPGGKAMQLASAGHDVTAIDFAEHRLERLRENLSRTGLKAELVAADILKWRPGRQFDSVLLDSPCSATGTFRRHPEVLYRARPRIIADSADLQAKLLDKSAGWVGPGGTVVYSVCSLERQEGEEIVSAFLRGHPDFRLDPPANALVPVSGEGWLRVLPGAFESDGGLDGFFTARLVRAA